MLRTTSLYRIIFALYIIVAILLFFYSYTQVDLNLTLSRINIWQTIQKSFQYIGYFQRPLSTGCFVALVICLFLLQVWVLSVVRKKQFSEVCLWKIIICIAVILVFAYPAFSYDFFNYMFTAKTVLVYHKNPYLVRPIDFTGIEPWLTFMRWTHLPSAYTPLWIGLSLIPYIFGFGYFLIILWNMKIMLALFYLITVWGIGKIMDIIDKPNRQISIVLFALNPLVIIESLVSPHNDIVMVALAVIAFLLFIKKRYLASFVSIACSIAIKIMTIALIPMFLFKWNRKIALVFITIALIAGFVRKELLPWYAVWVMPFIALYPVSEVIILGWGLTLGLLLRYAPFLYYGEYNQSVNLLRNWAVALPVSISCIYIVLSRIVNFIRSR